MSIAWKKRLTWALLYTCGAGTLLFFAICLLEGPPPAGGWWLWPISGVLGMLFSVLKLRAYYRAESTTYLSRPQLTLLDLWVLAGTVGLLLALWKAIEPNSFEYSGMVACLFSGLPVLGGVLSAAKRGYVKFFPRWMFAFGYALMIGSGLGVGALVMTVICVSLGRMESPLEVLERILHFNIGRSDFLSRYMVYSLLVLPLGFLLLFVARKMQCKVPAEQS